MKLFAIAGAALLGGALIGYLLCAAAARRYAKRTKAKRAAVKKKTPIGVMDKILILEAVILIAYTVADLIVFWHTYAEPYTLTACVFGVCGLENGVMGWIKTTKDKSAGGPDPGNGAPPPAG